MPDVVRDFFESLEGQNAIVPKTISGTLRFDIQDDGPSEHWLVTFDKGKVSARESDAPADCVTRMDRATLASIIDGRTNALAAVLRGTVSIEGRTLLLAVFRSLLQREAAAPQAPERERMMAGRQS